MSCLPQLNYVTCITMCKNHRGWLNKYKIQSAHLSGNGEASRVFGNTSDFTGNTWRKAVARGLCLHGIACAEKSDVDSALRHEEAVCSGACTHAGTTVTSTKIFSDSKKGLYKEGKTMYNESRFWACDFYELLDLVCWFGPVVQLGVQVIR